MRKYLLAIVSLGALAVTPEFASAQSKTTIGTGAGAVTGAVVGGPVGAVIGGVAGGFIGNQFDHRRRYRHVRYTRHHHAMY